MMLNLLIKSVKKNKIGISLMILCNILVTISQILWKISEVKNITFIIIGMLIYGLASFIMIIAFKYGDLSVLHPLLTLNYVFAIVLGYFLFKETITTYSIMGVITIVTGVILINIGDA